MENALRIDPDFSIKPLVIAVFENAVREARKGDRSARQWLYAEGVLWLDVVLDIHPDHVRRWLDRQFKLGKKPGPSQSKATQPGRAVNVCASLVR